MKMAHKCTAKGRNIIRNNNNVGITDESVANAGVPCVKPREFERVCPWVRRVDELLNGPAGIPASCAAVK
jgi:hypothetical protein